MCVLYGGPPEFVRCLYPRLSYRVSVLHFIFCFAASAAVAREDTGSKTLERPIAVITPLAAASAPRLDNELASYYTLESPDVLLTDSIDDVIANDEIKRTMGMLRMGRSMYDQQLEEDKRTMGMLRMGKRAMGMLRMGRSELAEEPSKRSMGMLRMGRSSNELDDNEVKRAMGMLRMGRGFEDDEKRSMGMLRMGRSQLAAEKDKKSMSMLRMGKR